MLKHYSLFGKPQQQAGDKSSSDREDGFVEVVVLDEVRDVPVLGRHLGQVKWFNDRIGWGFIFCRNGECPGEEIFVHHKSIKPCSSAYRTLTAGEYVNMDITVNAHGKKGAVNVTGVGGGLLMCDIHPARRPIVSYRGYS